MFVYVCVDVLSFLEIVLSLWKSEERFGYFNWKNARSQNFSGILRVSYILSKVYMDSRTSVDVREEKNTLEFVSFFTDALICNLQSDRKNLTDDMGSKGRNNGFKNEMLGII